MGALSDYLRREFGDDDDDIPGWEMTADRLRVRLHAFVKDCPLTSVRDLATLTDCATAIQVFHIRGKQLDEEDGKDEQE